MSKHLYVPLAASQQHEEQQHFYLHLYSLYNYHFNHTFIIYSSNHFAYLRSGALANLLSFAMKNYFYFQMSGPPSVPP